MYGAKNIIYTKEAESALKLINELNYSGLPVCIAKTQLSLSDNSKLKGRPEGFDVTIRDVRLSSGAGFIVPMAGNIMTMPGLPRIPAAESMDITEEGEITGLF